jgi:hypothetical protein
MSEKIYLYVFDNNETKSSISILYCLFSNFSCRFLNSNYFFRFEFQLFRSIRSEKPPGINLKNSLFQKIFWTFPVLKVRKSRKQNMYQVLPLSNKCQDHKADCANFWGLLRKAELLFRSFFCVFWNHFAFFFRLSW